MSETYCLLPHRRVTDDGDVVWDHEERRNPAAESMWICKGHMSRLRELLASTPKAVSWMREQLEPAKGDFERTASVKAGSKLPLSAAAVDSADETVALLCSWVSHAAEELRHPSPDMSSTWRVLKSRHTVDGELRVQGIRGEDLSIVDVCVRWMLDRVETIACCEWVGELLEELASQRGTALARWPYEERPRAVPRIPCDGCGRCTLVVYAPAFEPKYAVEPLLRGGRPVPLREYVGSFEAVIDPVDGSVARTSGVVAVPRVYSDGSPVVATVRVLRYAPPLLVQCQSLDCLAIVLPNRWDQLRDNLNGKVR